jgi:Na+-transporting NADH:ubiquinone oxidoreductase subunit F
VFEIGLGAGVFTTIVMALVLLILAARAWLVPTGEVDITVNGERHFRAAVGRRLIAVLAGDGIYLPAACGGRGTCGQCRVIVGNGGGAPVPVEMSLLSRRELKHGARLSCQLTLRENLEIEVPADLLGIRKLACKVRSSRSVATLMKEIVLEIAPGRSLQYEAGAYVQVTCPPHETRFEEFDIAPPYRGEWDRMNLWTLAVSSQQETARAYSIASHPGEQGIVTLIIRIATPPPGAGPSVPPGVVSSYLFKLRPGDPVEIIGPYGYFRVHETDREMIFVGGGAGMAPMRSMILDQLLCRRTTRKLSFWYGARNLRELFYREEFDRLQREAANFSWNVALSEPSPEDAWSGDSGFIHEVLYQRYLKDHPAPEECEYYLCGPPMMIKAVRHMLDSLGVEPESISYDDFGT